MDKIKYCDFKEATKTLPHGTEFLLVFPSRFELLMHVDKSYTEFLVSNCQNDYSHCLGLSVSEIWKDEFELTILGTDIMPQDWEAFPVIEDDVIYRQEVEGFGSFTVLDRMTGYGNGQRDTETGFTDVDNKFWLASGMFDIRKYPELTITETIKLIKKHANIVRGK